MRGTSAHDARDVSLTGNRSYFADSDTYSRWLQSNPSQKDRSTCNTFAAVANANTRRSTGLNASGVGAVVCRHDFWQPNGIADLKKGERYCSMDFIFHAVTKYFADRQIAVSYDIVCQWCKHLWERLDVLDDFLGLERQQRDVVFAIPKFHFRAHQVKVMPDGADDHSHFSLNFILGVGRTDAEGIERCWSGLNGAAASTKEMGPGARQDNLSNHCAYVNWCKTMHMGPLFARRLAAAVSETIRQTQSFATFNTILNERHPGQREKWEKMVLDWEDDCSRPSPYSTNRKRVTLAAVRLKLAQASPAAASASSDSAGATSDLFVSALEIEDLSRRITQDVQLKQSGSDSQAADILERRASLVRQLRRFVTQEQVLFPDRLEFLMDEDDPEIPTASPERHMLPLPSLYSHDVRTKIYSPEAINVEAQLRLAAMHESLDGVRDHLRMRTVVSHDKMRNVTGQGPNTRIRALQAQIEQRLALDVECYRSSRGRYLALVGDGAWTDKFRPLPDADVTGLSEKVQRREERLDAARDVREYFEAGGAGQMGEGRRLMSWIWHDSLGEDEGSTDEVLRIEWAKARARTARWEEEVRLLREEMRRALSTLQYEANHWLQLATSASSNASQNAEGLSAYAFKQSRLRLGLRQKLSTTWSSSLNDASRLLEASNIESLTDLVLSASLSTRVPESRELETLYGNRSTLYEIDEDELDDA